MNSTIQYLVVPAWSDQAGQCRIVRREHDAPHPDPLGHYRQYPQQWVDAGIMNSRGVVVALDAPPEVLQEFRDCEPIMAGTHFSFPASSPDRKAQPNSLEEPDEDGMHPAFRSNDVPAA